MREFAGGTTDVHRGAIPWKPADRMVRRPAPRGALGYPGRNSPVNDDLDDVNPSNNQTLRSVVATRVSRRSLLRGATVAAAGVAVAANGAEALLGSVPVDADGGRRHPATARASATPGYAAARVRRHRVSTADTVVVPPGYTASVLIAWAIRCRTGRCSTPTRPTPPRNRHSNGGCTTTGSCTSRSATRRRTG